MNEELRVIELMKMRGMTQTQLAEKMGITRVGLAKAISGNTTVATLRKLADALGVPITSLFRDNKPVYPCPKCGAKLVLVEYVEEPLTLAKPQKEAGEEKESKE